MAFRFGFALAITAFWLIQGRQNMHEKKKSTIQDLGTNCFSWERDSITFLVKKCLKINLFRYTLYITIFPFYLFYLAKPRACGSSWARDWTHAQQWPKLLQWQHWIFNWLCHKRTPIFPFLGSNFLFYQFKPPLYILNKYSNT